MIPEPPERRSEFRFPVVVPVEYFRPDDSGILSYALNLNLSGTFISSDDPLSIGTRFGLHLTIPVDYESSRIFRTEGTVAWNKVQPFKSKRNGMGVQFIEPLPEGLLVMALADTTKKLIQETKAKRLLEERINKLESKQGETKRLAAIGRYVEKILFEITNPILTLSGILETMKEHMYAHKKMLEERAEINRKELKRLVVEFERFCNEIDILLEEYKLISELAQIAGDDRETLEGKLRERFKC